MANLKKAVEMVSLKIYLAALCSGTQKQRKGRMKELADVLVSYHNADPKFARLCWLRATAMMFAVEGDEVACKAHRLIMEAKAEAKARDGETDKG